MNTLVLGSSGMLGHKMLERLRLRFNNVYGLSREDGLNVYDPNRIKELIESIKPSVIINCVGYIKQRGLDELQAMRINARFPRWLQQECEQLDARLIHFSTDCVFSGTKGNYVETDLPDPKDIYGYTKFLGEVIAKNTLTIRTSIVGRERRSRLGLLEWFLNQPNGAEIDGHVNAIYSGVTTNWLTDFVGSLLDNTCWYSGLYHVAGEAVSKYELLNLFKEAYNKDVRIRPVATPVCDRSLDGSRLASLTGVGIPTQRSLLFSQQVQDKGKYDAIR